MKIIALQANNIKKLTAVHIAPNGESVVLAGDNGAGKSSVLDAIAYALGGTSDVCEQPIRRGESEAEIVCKLPGLTVTRKFSAAGSSLKVTDADGKSQRSPQAILDSLVGNLAFDPLEFSRKKPTDQADTLRKLVGLDFAVLDAEKARVYNDRLLIGREVDALKGKTSGYVPTMTIEEVSVAVVIEKKNAAVAKNKANEIERAKLREVQEARDRNVKIKESLEVRLLELEKELACARAVSEKLAAQANEQLAIVDKLVDEDTKVFDAELLEADVKNSAVRKNREYAAQTAEWKSKAEEYGKHTARLDEIETEKRKTLAAVKFPLPELSFSEAGGVTYNGFPFAQASDGEKLRVSVAIGMALNPKLRVIFIRDGSLLDSAGLKVISDLAAANDYQVWLEDARSTDPTAVVIEDGHIKAP